MSSFSRIADTPVRDWALVLNGVRIPDNRNTRELRTALWTAINDVVHPAAERGDRAERFKRQAEAEALAAQLLTIREGELRRAGHDIPTKRGPGRLVWRVLPEGASVNEFAAFYRQHFGGSSPDPEVVERLEPLFKLRPHSWYEGQQLGRRDYVVAIFPGVAIADCPDYGNALYYYRCNDASWQRVLSLEKSEALLAGAERIIHRDGWKRDLPKPGEGRWRRPPHLS
ncbi:MAG: hypothetical protein ACKVVT_11165 [Dehalococcoidia bacterium]